jgi:hypothetical protein
MPAIIRHDEAPMTSIETLPTPPRKKLAPDFASFATQHINIRGKGGALCPLAFNRAQQHIHALIEEQQRRTGRVRALILKGRQQGCSTYVAARFFHRAMHGQGLRVFILAHEDAATANLFDIVKRFQAHCGGRVRVPTIAVNANGLTFAETDSSYTLGTAGTKGVGRSSTIQLFHGSEVAFWPHAETHAAGVLQAVPDAEGTEIILESTASGPGNFFHRTWRDAEAGRNGYVPVFVPWYWQDEYRAAADGFDATEEERAHGELYGLDDAQLAWRRRKIAELKDAGLFRQEYPACAAEAFETSGHDSFIPAALVAAARKAQCEASGPLVIGFDPAWKGDDRHAMAWRQGRRLIKVETRSKLDTMQAAGWLKFVIDRDRPSRAFVDVGGVGAGVYDRLVEMGYGTTVTAVNFGAAPLEPARGAHGGAGGGPLNRRAEMWMKSKEWLADPAGVQIPDSDALQADACGPGYSYDSSTRLMLEKKEDMRRRGVPSPDEWDAVALTFAEPVGADPRWSRKLVYPNLGIV